MGELRLGGETCKGTESVNGNFHQTSQYCAVCYDLHYYFVFLKRVTNFNVYEDGIGGSSYRVTILLFVPHFYLYSFWE